LVERLAVRVSSFRGKPQDEKASKFRETLEAKGNPEPSPKREGAETRHSLPKSPVITRLTLSAEAISWRGRRLPCAFQVYVMISEALAGSRKNRRFL